MDWYRVERCLPEPYVPVLARMPGEKPFPTVHEGYITPDGTWVSGMFRRKPGEVTHWAEMPEYPGDDEPDAEEIFTQALADFMRHKEELDHENQT